MPQSTDSADATIRSLAIAVYLPIIVFAIGEGAVVPFIVLGAQNLGASAALAGAVFALSGVGSVVSAVPAGTLVSRVGSRRAAVVAVATTLLGLTGLILSTSVATYAVSIFVMGIGWSVWRLVRFDFLAGAIPAHRRGRALSLMGGSQRMGRFVGPLLAAALIATLGLDGAFYLHMVVAVIALAVFVSVPLTDVERPPRGEQRTLLRLAADHRRSFGTAGIGFVILVILRSALPVVLPLWAIHIGLDAAAVGVIFGASSAVDAALFYPAGVVMDRAGRKWVAMISIIILAGSFFLVPLAGSFVSLLGVGLLMGFGNGIGSGYGATVGSDLAPPEARAEFLGLWQMMANLGNTGGPLLLGGLVAVASIGFASVAIGVIGVLGAAHVATLVPETLVASEN
jgi:MFS family permease